MESFFNEGSGFFLPQDGIQNIPPLGFKPNAMRNKFRFVIKEHHATRIHYDFRLEFPGTLKSWVIGIEGPTLKPNSARKMVMVGDHNPKYIYREGIIPAGQYGAGEMIVWDKGCYFPRYGGKSKSEDKEILNAMLNKGELDFFIMGHKLKGRFRLTGNMHDKNSWILIKQGDIYCSDDDLTKLNRSVFDGKSIMDWRIKKNSGI